MSKRTKFAPPKFKLKNDGLITDYLVSSPVEIVYRRHTFGLRTVCVRTALDVTFGLMIALWDGKQFVDEWDWLASGNARDVLSDADAREFRGWLQSTFALHGAVEPELFALIGKIIDKVFLSPNTVAKADLTKLRNEETQRLMDASVPWEVIPTFDFGGYGEGVRSWTYKEHACQFAILLGQDDLGWYQSAQFRCDGVEVTISHEDVDQNDLIWTALNDAIYEDDFENWEFKAAVCNVLDRHIAKIEAAQATGNGWNDHFGAEGGAA